MVLLYSDNPHIDTYWMSEITLDRAQVTHSFDKYKNTQADLKVAFTACRYDCKFDQDRFATVEDRIEHLSKTSNLVFVFDYNFYTDQYYPLWNRLPYNNIYWVVPGELQTNEAVAKNIVTWPGWFVGATGTYRLLPHLINKISPVLPKPLIFDALLGRPREHRDFVYNAIINSPYRNKIVTTYLKSHDQMQDFLQNEFVWDQDCQVNGNLNGMQDHVMYHGHSVGLYSIIPIDLYNQTAYSIIAETNIDNRITFFTEKIVKPILGRRLFVVFTGWKFLENLRKLGFKTFNDIIDESYDQIEDSTSRYTAAFKQVEQLCSMDQREVYNKIKDITDHNYRVMVDTDWDREMSKSLQKIINDNSTI